MLRDASDWTSDEPDHERFVHSLVDRNVILLGGPLDGEPVGGVSAAYVLRCSDIDEARAVVATESAGGGGSGRGDRDAVGSCRHQCRCDR